MRLLQVRLEEEQFEILDDFLRQYCESPHKARWAGGYAGTIRTLINLLNEKTVFGYEVRRETAARLKGD